MKLFTLSLLLALDLHAGDLPMPVTFGIPSTTETIITNTKPSELVGRFWVEWIVETNDEPRVAMVGFDDHFWFGLATTNFAIHGIETNGGWFGLATPNCQKEHLDRSQQTVTKYVSSNLVSFLVWRGRTNSHYLESIPVTNIVRHWHWDKKQVWED